jgi:hypothetical protein
MDVIAKSVGISNVEFLSNLAPYMQGCGTDFPVGKSWSTDVIIGYEVWEFSTFLC